MIADEIGYLLNARVISGGPGGDLSTATFYRGGYSLLLSPLFLVDQSPVWIYHEALAINSLVGAAIFPATYLLIGKLFDISSRARLAAAFAAACTPSLIFTAGFATSDAVLPTMLVVFVVLLLELCAAERLDARASFLIVAFAAISALLWITHARGQLVVLIVGSLVIARCFLAASSRLRARLALGAIAAAIMVSAGTMMNRYLASSLYSRSGGDLPGWTKLLHADHHVALGDFFGQLWSLSVTTGGLSLIGLIVLWTRGRRLFGTYALGASLTIAILGIAAATTFTADPVGFTAESYSIYSRYLDMFAPLLVGLGCAGIAASMVRARVWFAVALSMPILAFAVAMLDPKRTHAGDSRPYAVPIVTFMSGVAPSSDHLFVDTSLPVATAVGMVFLITVGAISLRHRALWRTYCFGPCCALALLAGTWATVAIGYTLDAHFYPTGRTGAVSFNVAKNESVIWDTGQIGGATARFIYEFSTGHKLVQFDSATESLPVGDILITGSRFVPPPDWKFVGPALESRDQLVYRRTRQ